MHFIRPKKPEPPKPDKRTHLDVISDISKISRQIFNAYILLMVFGTLSALLTSDVSLVINETIRFPFVNLNIGRTSFFIGFPIILIAVYVYLHLYLHRLEILKEEERRTGEKSFPQYYYPWIINIARNADPGFIGYLQKSVVIVTLWVLPLVCISILSWIYTKTHNVGWAFFVSFLPLIALVIETYFGLKYRNINRDIVLKTRSFRLIAGIILTSVAGYTLILLWCLSLASRGEEHPIFSRAHLLDGTHHKNLIDNSEIAYDGIYWGDFTKLRLEGANITGSILERADLRNTRLTRASLESANLRYANLSGTNLENTNLRNADLTFAILHRAILDGADLTDAEINGTNLDSASLIGSNISNLRLFEASTRGIVLDGAICNACNLDKVDLSRTNIKSMKLTNTIIHGIQLLDADSQTVSWLLDNRGLEYSGADISNLRLRGFSLKNVTADSSLWTNTRMTDVKMNKVFLHFSILDSVHLEKVSFAGAIIENSSMRSAEIRASGFRHAEFKGTDLRGTQFLDSCDLALTKFQHANLDSASIIYADIGATSFDSASMVGAHLNRSTLVKASFVGADLTDTDFCDSDLRDADFTGAIGLDWKQLIRAKSLYNAKLDSGIEAELKSIPSDLFKEPSWKESFTAFKNELRRSF